MKIIGGAVLAAVVWGIAAGHAASAGAASDREAIIGTVRAMFDAAKHDDLAKFHTLAAADFYAYDGGKRFDGDALMLLIRQLHASGKIYEWQVTDPQVHIEGRMAWMTYVNRGYIQDQSGKKRMTWLESVVLGRERGVWRVHFVHSTRVP